ncbi:hypothetical protein ACWCXX_06375 [Streptomyces sp. NPDC001732]
MEHDGEVAEFTPETILRDIERQKRHLDREGELDADTANQLLVDTRDAYLSAASTSLDRALTRTNILITSAAAVTTAYTALLGLIYSVKDNRAAPAIAMVPVIFLGASVALAVAYASFLSSHSFKSGDFLPVSKDPDAMRRRLVNFLLWIDTGVSARSWALRGAVVSLGLGLVTLPFGVVAPHGSAAAAALSGAFAAACALTAWISAAWRSEKAERVKVEKEKEKEEIPIPQLPQLRLPLPTAKAPHSFRTNAEHNRRS